MNPELREIALNIFHRTIAAIDIESVVRARLHSDGTWLLIGEESVDLQSYLRVVVIGIGKACVPMARAVEQLLEDRIADGLLVTNTVVGEPPRRLPVLLGGHPLPNAVSIEAASSALRILRDHDASDTLVLFLITGGGSAMFEQPIAAAITLDDLQAINRALVSCGAVINEMNVVRR
jgi:glycerate 2-kinase